MLNRITARELVEWQVFDQVHGLPDRRGDNAAGAIAATMVNIAPRKKGSARKALKPDDFFKWLKPQKAPSTAEAMRGAWAEIVAANDGLIFEMEPDEHDS